MCFIDYNFFPILFFLGWNIFTAKQFMPTVSPISPVVSRQVKLWDKTQTNFNFLSPSQVPFNSKKIVRRVDTREHETIYAHTLKSQYDQKVKHGSALENNSESRIRLVPSYFSLSFMLNGSSSLLAPSFSKLRVFSSLNFLHPIAKSSIRQPTDFVKTRFETKRLAKIPLYSRNNNTLNNNWKEKVKSDLLNLTYQPKGSGSASRLYRAEQGLNNGEHSVGFGGQGGWPFFYGRNKMCQAMGCNPIIFSSNYNIRLFPSILFGHGVNKFHPIAKAYNHSDSNTKQPMVNSLQRPNTNSNGVFCKVFSLSRLFHRFDLKLHKDEINSNGLANLSNQTLDKLKTNNNSSLIIALNENKGLNALSKRSSTLVSVSSPTIFSPWLFGKKIQNMSKIMFPIKNRFNEFHYRSEKSIKFNFFTRQSKIMNRIQKRRSKIRVLLRTPIQKIYSLNKFQIPLCFSSAI